MIKNFALRILLMTPPPYRFRLCTDKKDEQNLGMKYAQAFVQLERKLNTKLIVDHQPPKTSDWSMRPLI